MCGVPSISVLLVTVGTGTWWSMGPIFLRASPAWAMCLLGWPHSGFTHFVATAALTLTAPRAFRVLPTFAVFAAFTSSVTLATHPTACPALAACPVMLGMIPDGGIFGVRRGVLAHKENHELKRKNLDEGKQGQGGTQSLMY